VIGFRINGVGRGNNHGRQVCYRRLKGSWLHVAIHWWREHLIRQNLDYFGFEEKRTALKALKIKAKVTATEVQVKGVLGIEPDLATNARTSGRMFKSNQKHVAVPFRITAQLNKV